MIHTRAPASLESVALNPMTAEAVPGGSWNAVLRNYTGPRTVAGTCQPCVAAARTAAIEKLPPNLAEEVRKGERQLYEVALTPNAVSNEASLVDVYFEGNKLTTVRLSVEVPKAIAVPLRVGTASSLVFRSNRGGSEPLVVYVNGEPTAMKFGPDGSLAMPLLIPAPVARTVSYVARTADGSQRAHTISEVPQIDYNAKPPEQPVQLQAAPAKVPTCPTTPAVDE